MRRQEVSKRDSPISSTILGVGVSYDRLVIFPVYVISVSDGPKVLDGSIGITLPRRIYSGSVRTIFLEDDGCTSRNSDLFRGSLTDLPYVSDGSRASSSSYSLLISMIIRFSLGHLSSVLPQKGVGTSLGKRRSKVYF